MAGTEVMTIADLNEMEARVDIGEMDIVLIAAGQCVHLEVDAFKDRKFNGVVTEIANSSKTAGFNTSSSADATKFEVRIRIKEKEAFRPGMSVTADIETRSRTNVLAVPIPCVTTRLPKSKDAKGTNVTGVAASKTNSASPAPSTNSVTASNPAPAATNAPKASNDTLALSSDPPSAEGTNSAAADKKAKETPKAIEVVFVMEGDQAKMVPVKIGISDDNYWEILEGLTEGQEVITGGYKAVSRELEDGKKVRKGTLGPEDKDKDKEAKK
jgi:HlyD family secretion protein